ncbi:Tat binding protein 1-interacting protein [Encephalitozoon hellem ATCC 50504]|uniref:Tat binding protein 1-interacting protein n=1 Tax=Encephalitozoon hellem TaxID=27973 RepID=A0A9Q9F7K5_ENCHE|nr:Tat binding protein 1-interacting protein [Encephalitozoon hellem ATCC 50504]AFM97707.1 Tat binding protein 1-interacting protein [Encephalitozoon hellem ATCC 50504]UTX42398.1 Tat binding protein 1-interacting protein [Encephalitozoon hellem]WEL37840.1 Tat binding protein 1-interacting protein [Encephalitozoon hellem]|eukprot:XP_003886688.1 Tat binding protein 1-interacting protein [Encephalitozoon hellem ATCC 50504]
MKEDYDDDEERVFQMMYKCNRPTSKSEIVAYFKGEIGGTAIQEILNYLESDGRLVTKTYGKTKIYLVNQDLFQNEEDVKLSTELQGYEEKIKLLAEEIGSLDAEIKMLDKMMSIDQLEESIEALDRTVKDNQKRLEGFRDGGREVSKKEMDGAKKKYERAQSGLKKVRRIFNEIVERLSEGMDMKKSELYEEIGIEV